MNEKKDEYFYFYHRILNKAYKFLEEWKEDMNKLSDRDKHLIDAIIKSSWNYKTKGNSEEWAKSSRKLTIGIKEGIKTKEDLIERLAHLVHEQWAHWMKYQLEIVRGNFIEYIELLGRWQRQMNTSYKYLTEKEKDSDREWARRYLEVFMDEKNK